MWEITLIGEKKDYVYFLLLEDLLIERLNVKPIIAISCKKNLVCSIAIEDKKHSKKLKKIIFEIIIRICKEEYFKDNINNLGSEYELNKFIILSLTNMGINDEIDYAIVKARLTKTIHIRSLMSFKLSKLFSIWEKMINYFNIVFFCDKNLEFNYLHYLKFLAENSKSNNIMYLEDKNETIQILDKDKKVLSSISKSDEIGVIVNLIIQSPKKLIVNCYDKLSSKITSLMEYIFGDKLFVLL